MRLAVASAGLLLCCAPALAAAQPGGSRAADVRTLGDCPLAARVVSSGRPAPRDAWALDLISGCGAEGGAALAVAVRATRQSTDVAALDRLTAQALRLRDGQLFAASLDVAADTAASVPARVFALRAALQSVSYLFWFDNYAALVHPPRNGLETCEEAFFSHDMALPGAPLPADAPARLRTVVGRLAGDGSAPAEVRAVARCVGKDVDAFAP